MGDKEITKKEEKQSENKENTDFRENCFPILHNENKLFASRVNLLLVAESLLFISYVTVLCCNTNKSIFVSYTIIFSAIFLTLFIGYVNIRASINLENLKKKIDEEYPFHKKLRDERIWGSANIVLSYFITILFLITWIVFLVIQICCSV